MSPIGPLPSALDQFWDPKYLGTILKTMSLGAPRYGAMDVANLPVSPRVMMSPDIPASRCWQSLATVHRTGVPVPICA